MHLKPWQIVALIAGGILGYLGNIYANRQNNKELIAMLKEQGFIVQQKLNTGRLTESERNALIEKQIAIEKQIETIKRRNLYLV